MPALNEELAIGQTIREIPLKNAEVIVIDNGSIDNTILVAKKYGAKVIFEPRRGYGYACLAGIKLLNSMISPPDLVIFLDADRSDYPKDILKLLKVKLQNNNSPDLVMGKRFLQSGAMPPHAIIANKVFTKLIHLLYRVKLEDMGPLRIIDFQILIELDMKDTGYGWASEMIVKIIKMGYSIKEVDVGYRQRIGKSKISGSIITSLRAVIWLTFHILRHAI